MRPAGRGCQAGCVRGVGVVRALSSAWEQPGAGLSWGWLPGKGTLQFPATLQDARAQGTCLHDVVMTWCVQCEGHTPKTDPPPLLALWSPGSLIWGQPHTL